MRVEIEVEIEVERYELSRPPSYRFEVERRDFLRIFACARRRPAGRLGARRRRAAGVRRRRPAAASRTTWRPGFTSDEAGRITGYTGKTEIGQNIRTSLAQAIADELRVPLTAVALVMADTDLVPFDQGTFGSLSTPRMAPVLARAAATAREMLIDRAAALWSVDRATLTCKDARISAAGRIDRLRRSRQGPEARRHRSRRGPRVAAGVVDDPRHGRKQGQRPELRHRRASLHAGHHAAGHDVRPSHPLRRLHRHARLVRRRRGASACRRGRRPRRRLRRRRRADRAARAPRGGRRPRRVAHAVRRAVVGDGLRTSQEDRRHRAAAAAARRFRPATSPTARSARGPHLRRQLSHSLHRARAARAACRGRRMGRRQADRVDRHAAAVRRARRTGGGVPRAGGAGARHRAGHRLRLWRQAHGRARRRSGAAGEGGRQAGQARVDAQGRVLVRVLPSGGRDRHQGRRRCGRPVDVVGVRQLELRRLGDPHAVRGPESAHPVPRLGLAASPGLVPRAGGDGQPLRARDAHGRHRARARRRCRRVPAAASEGRADARRAARRRRRSPAGRVRRRPAAGSASRAGPRRAATSPPRRKSAAPRTGSPSNVSSSSSSAARSSTRTA